MKKALLVIHDLVLAILVELISWPLSLLVPIVALFAKWDSKWTNWTGGEYDGEHPAIRGDLPRWAYIWSTPDERLPGDVRMYQTREVLDWTTKKFGEKVGRYLTSVWWLWRNRMYGLAWIMSAKPSNGYFDKTLTPGIIWRESEGIWRWWKVLGLVQLEAGWKIHRANTSAHWMHGPFVAIRYVSVRKAK
jgi:hypothetical protein